MVAPESGPFLFDTSVESLIGRRDYAGLNDWVARYLVHCEIQVSAVTVLERVRGYSTLWQRSDEPRRRSIEIARRAYLSAVSTVRSMDGAVAVVAAEILALLPEPQTAPKRTHRHAESRQERLARWRFDAIIAATALVSGMHLVHNNAEDFESIRSAVERAPERFPGMGPLGLIRVG